MINQKKVCICADDFGLSGSISEGIIDLVSKKGANIRDIYLISLLAAPEGLKNIQKKQKGIHIFTCSIDSKLDKNKFIVPGLGDAGDRYMGT